jgi:hypothetical protein
VTFAAQWLLQDHLAAGQETIAAARYFIRPLQGPGGFPVTLAEPAEEATGDPVSRGAWSGREATPDPAALPYYNDAQDRLSRAYVREEDGQAAGPQCLLWMVHFRDGRDRQHHPLVCCKVAGCTENSSGHEAVQLEGPGSPAQRFCFTRDDDPGYLSYVYYWHYTFEAPAGLSPLQRLHAAWAVRPSLTVEVFTTARTPQQLDQSAEFVRLVDRQLKSHLPPGARRGSEALPITARR